MKLNQLNYYCGPNRRSDQTMVEAEFRFDLADSEIISEGWLAAIDYVQLQLAAAGIILKSKHQDQFSSPNEVFRGFCQLYCEISMQLQQHYGHHVYLSDCFKSTRPGSWIALFEHEESSVGKQAALLTLQLFDQAWPALEVSRLAPGASQNFEKMIALYSELASSLAQPVETAAIVAAAKRAGVPVIKLERDPYEPVKGDFRIRMNSMLMLGHCANRQIIDGCFALEKSGPAAVLLRDRLKIMATARQLGMPVPSSTNRALNSTESARLAAQEIGYPLTVKPLTRSALDTDSRPILDAEQLEKAVQKVQAASEHFLVEQHTDGKLWNLLVVNNKLLCVIDSTTGRVHHGKIHDSLGHLAVSASRELHVGVLVLTLICPDLTRGLSDTGGIVTDLQVAPELDTLLSEHPDLLEQAADEFIRWLVPTGAESAIPIVAVTGTNGKTTTSRMIDHVIRQCGRRTGMQCTDGQYIGGKLVDPGDKSMRSSHLRIFEDKSIDTAVLETHHRGMAISGFAFDYCNVAVCTNVTNDHIGTFGLESVEDMAILKRSLLERTRECAVLNADDPHCLAMIPFINSRRICLTSLHKSPAELSTAVAGGFYCLVKSIGGKEWVVLHEVDQVHEIMPVEEIPATFSGLARFNLSNAIQAIAASYAMGIDLDTIRTAMKLFHMSAANTPGRLNFYPGLPFQVLVDFAHNPDGVRRISEFTDGMQISGRKIVAFSGFRKDPTVIEIASEIAGHFDLYMIKNYGIPKEMNIEPVADPARVPRLVKSVLSEKGVPEGKIIVELDEMTAVHKALDLAGDGDLVVLLLGYAGMKVIGEFMDAYIAGRQ